MTEDENETYAKRHIQNIGLPLSIHFEPRNEPEPWIVSIRDWPDDGTLCPHVHARTLHHGLKELDKLWEQIRKGAA